LYIDKLELHVNRRREVGLGGSELLQLEDLA
jgi:hypothetical protein